MGGAAIIGRIDIMNEILEMRIVIGEQVIEKTDQRRLAGARFAAESARLIVAMIDRDARILGETGEDGAFVLARDIAEIILLDKFNVVIMCAVAHAAIPLLNLSVLFALEFGLAFLDERRDAFDEIQTAGAVREVFGFRL